MRTDGSSLLAGAKTAAVSLQSGSPPVFFVLKMGLFVLV
jgi:hypothetical protein